MLKNVSNYKLIINMCTQAIKNIKLKLKSIYILYVNALLFIKLYIHCFNIFDCIIV